MEEVEQLTGVEGVKVEVEEVEEVDGSNRGRKGPTFSRFRIPFLRFAIFTESSSVDSFDECSEKSSGESSP